MFERFVPLLLQRYGIPYLTILSVQKGYRNEIYPIQLSDTTTIQLTFFKDEPDIIKTVARADTVSRFVASHGMPARQRVDNRTIRMHSQHRNIYAGLYNYLPGMTITWDGYTQAHLKSLGKTMSDLHAVLADFPINDQPRVIDQLDSLLGRMEQYFCDNDVVQAIEIKLKLRIDPLDSYEGLLKGCRNLKHIQQLHMDFVRGNVLFQPSTAIVTGILDFEKTAVGHPLFDVARTLAFLLVDCKYKSEAQVQRYFLKSGYIKRGAAHLEYDAQLLDRLVAFFLLHDFYKFLRHNPYEALSSNEHFVRTQYMLLQRGMIHYV